MKKILTPLLLAAAGLVLASAANANALVLEPIVNPLDPAPERTATAAPSAFEIRSLSIADAKSLLDSTEGPAWKVLGVQAPACESTKKKGKVEFKKCQAVKAECKNAEAFARAHANHAACSALYSQTTVLLTNDAPPGRYAKAATTTHKVSKSVHKHPAKKAPVSGKPAAGSCDK
jgi:hypothetical protein